LRTVKCNAVGCGHIWESGAKSANLKCKKCQSVDIQDNYVDPYEQETQNEQETPEVKLVPKEITCPRCKGDGIWHTSRTGARLATIAGPTEDASKVCPECNGKKVVTIQVPEETE
jgi:Zn finger protein HypA/HybF involved in hydrogenase expression